MPAHKWTFAPRFRRSAFGWRSALPVQRIKEAISEIRSAARVDPVLGAEGAVLLLEKLSPALEQVDSSSGALGSAVNRAIDVLVPVIAAADVPQAVRDRWLERLFEALQEDQMPYIESLGEHWGTLCVTPELASRWADQLLPLTRHVVQADEYGFFVGTIPCLSALHAAGRFEVESLVSLGRPGDAVSLAESSRGLNAPEGDIARRCETILLDCGRTEEAYQRYALAANRAATYLATFRAIAKKYPDRAPQSILADLIESEPGSLGKWFAAAKDAGLLDIALSLAKNHPTDPKTLTRAARDFEVKQPSFAMACGLCALRWMDAGYGYEIAPIDVLDAYDATVKAAAAAGVQAPDVQARVRQLVGAPSSLIAKVLATKLA
ncbi:hypothetical protein AWB67_06077 [Caballeronia terrestris]|uniref:Uncharacterized protein n=1 Tax=Caballeronia terrestris TaxID=1226301 RepID=A0A158KMA1_9BURK|nr:hypothetical protein [Caballeronia terrestris]SAL82266.1 hypothetical protein AWB67_06077 [Caballeronia terrestris]